jgi:hypothetical protein
LSAADEVLCVDNFYTGTRHNVQHLLANPMFEISRHDICFPLYVEVDEIYNLACPASPVHYQFDPVQTTKVSKDLASVDLRSLWRSDRASAKGGLLGECESCWSALLL